MGIETVQKAGKNKNGWEEESRQKPSKCFCVCVCKKDRISSCGSLYSPQLVILIKCLFSFDWLVPKVFRSVLGSKGCPSTGEGIIADLSLRRSIWGNFMDWCGRRDSMKHPFFSWWKLLSLL